MVGLRDYALLMLLARLGLRASEVAGLRLDDFDWPAALVTAKVKGGGRLRLPIPADVGHAVVAYLRRRPAGATCRELFVQVRGAPRPMTSRAVTQVVARHAARVGLGVVRAHRLRHSAARGLRNPQPPEMMDAARRIVQRPCTVTHKVAMRKVPVPALHTGPSPGR